MNTRLIQFAAAVAVALTVSNLASAADPTPADLQKAIDAVEKATNELKSVRKDLANVSVLHQRVIQAESEVKILREEIADLKRKTDSQTSTSMKPDTSTSFKGMGRVRFINEHPSEMTVVVNSLAYRLAPGQEKLIPVIPGAYSYQVLQIHQTPRFRQIVADQTKTFTIYAAE